MTRWYRNCVIYSLDVGLLQDSNVAEVLEQFGIGDISLSQHYRVAPVP